jgi:catechol 2,3-dioxygenase-like lactoylglutathione lyase family enzyme
MLLPGITSSNQNKTGQMNATARGITGIDHVLVGVRDLEGARELWQRLGFTMSPRGHHIGWGTANYCAMFERGYVELLGVVDPQQFTNHLDEFLTEREGAMGVAFATDDAMACSQALAAANFSPEGPTELKRSLETQAGEVMPAFSLVHLPPDKTPEMRAFVCQHLTPDLIRRPEWLRHANSARRLVSVTIASDDPVGAAFGYEPLFDADAVKVANGLTAIVHNGMALRFAKPGMLAAIFPGVTFDAAPKPPYIVGMKIEVADQAKAKAHLEGAGIAPIAIDRGLIVAPQLASGVLLEMVQF